METVIKNLKVGDRFTTATGKREYEIIDIVFSQKLGTNVWLLKDGWYVHNADKKVRLIGE